MLKNEPFYIGVDLHKSVIQTCVLNRDGKIVDEQRYEGDALKDGLKVVEELARWRKVAHLAVESVGMNRWFVLACRAAGFRVTVVDPVKLNLRMLGKKTDRRDAYEIARRLMLGDIERNARTYFPTEEEYGIRKVLRTRHKLVSLRLQLVCQIRALLRAYRIAAPTGSLYLPRNLKKLRTLEMPNENLEACHLASVAALEAMHASVRRLDDEILKQSKRPEVAALIHGLPSTGPQTATTLLYELGDVTRFKNSRAVASYAGLAPIVANSGGKQNHGRITKRGNPELRWILSEMAVRLMSRNEQVKDWARPRLRTKHKNKVRIALARRLLIGIYRTLKFGEVFSLEKCLATRTA